MFTIYILVNVIRYVITDVHQGIQCQREMDWMISDLIKCSWQYTDKGQDTIFRIRFASNPFSYTVNYPKYPVSKNWRWVLVRKFTKELWQITGLKKNILLQRDKKVVHKILLLGFKMILYKNGFHYHSFSIHITFIFIKINPCFYT